MPEKESEIMRDTFYFLRDHNDPPPMGTDACTAFWEKTAADIGMLVGGKWKNHPLATGILMAVYEYLEWKCKQKAGGKA